MSRLGIDTPDDEFDEWEIALIVNALNNQRRYSRGLASRNKDPEAAGRNHLNALELQVLMEKVKKIGAHKAVSRESHGVTVTVHPSAGADGAVVVQIDTSFEPDGSDGPGLRVNINDSSTYEGVAHAAYALEEDEGS